MKQTFHLGACRHADVHLDFLRLFCFHSKTGRPSIPPQSSQHLLMQKQVCDKSKRWKEGDSEKTTKKVESEPRSLRSADWVVQVLVMRRELWKVYIPMRSTYQCNLSCLWRFNWKSRNAISSPVYHHSHHLQVARSLNETRISTSAESWGFGDKTKIGQVLISSRHSLERITGKQPS